MPPDTEYLKQEIKDIQAEIKEIRNDLVELRTRDITSILVEVGKLQTKAGIWGGIAGIVAVVASILLKML